MFASNEVYLQHALALILVFIGSKMIAEFFGFEVPVVWFLLSVVGLLVGGMLLSMVAQGSSFQRSKAQDAEPRTKRLGGPSSMPFG